VLEGEEVNERSFNGEGVREFGGGIALLLNDLSGCGCNVRALQLVC
jgi:hypothetical protein